MQETRKRKTCLVINTNLSYGRLSNEIDDDFISAQGVLLRFAASSQRKNNEKSLTFFFSSSDCSRAWPRFSRVNIASSLFFLLFFLFFFFFSVVAVGRQSVALRADPLNRVTRVTRSSGRAEERGSHLVRALRSVFSSFSLSLSLSSFLFPLLSAFDNCIRFHAFPIRGLRLRHHSTRVFEVG